MLPEVVQSAGASALIGAMVLPRVVERLPLMLEQRWRAEATEERGIDFTEPRIGFLGCLPQGKTQRVLPVILAALACVAWSFSRFDERHALVGTMFLWGMMALAFIDARHRLLPDVITMPLLWTGLALAASGYGFVSAQAGIFGAMLGYLLLAGVARGYERVTDHEGLAPGDFKMLAAIGAWIGWQVMLAVFLLAGFACGVVGLVLIASGRRMRSEPLPFGPYLALAGAFVMDRHGWFLWVFRMLT